MKTILYIVVAGVVFVGGILVPFSGTVTGQKQGTYKDGKEHGPWVMYHKNGQLEDKGTYRDGKKDGPWVSYHKNGQLEYKVTYKDGVKVK